MGRPLRGRAVRSPNYPKGEWFDGYSADGPFEEVYKGARVFRAREIPRKGNTGKTIFELRQLAAVCGRGGAETPARRV